jgi:hypothetical protein
MEEGITMSEKKKAPTVGAFLAIGVGVGAGFGVATGNIPMGVALGAGIGAALGYHLAKRARLRPPKQ